MPPAHHPLPNDDSTLLYGFIAVFILIPIISFLIYLYVNRYNKKLLKKASEQSKVWTICPNCGELIWLQTFLCNHCKTENELVPFMDGSADVHFQNECRNCHNILSSVHFWGREKLIAVCPKCHQPAGSQAGVYHEIIVPIIGNRSTGKSAFLAALLYQMQQRYGNRLSFPFKGQSVYVEDALRNYASGTLPPQTPVDQPIGFVTDIAVSKNAEDGLRLFFYDPGGELYNKETAMNSLKYFDFMDEMIILVDPFTIPYVHSLFDNGLKSFSSFQTGAGSFEDNVERIKNGMPKFHYRNYEYENKDNDNNTHPYLAKEQIHYARCAVVFTKTDAFGLDEIIGEAAVQKAMKDNPQLSYEEAMHNVCLKKLEDWNLGNSIRLLEKMFDEVRCFSVSALGNMPDEHQHFVPQPQRVEYPLLWFLQQKYKNFV